jgi:hypothetical protein
MACTIRFMDRRNVNRLSMRPPSVYRNPNRGIVYTVYLTLEQNELLGSRHYLPETILDSPSYNVLSCRRCSCASVSVSFPGFGRKEQQSASFS